MALDQGELIIPVGAPTASGQEVETLPGNKVSVLNNMEATGGDDAGIQFLGQVAVGKPNAPNELVVGQGDSTVSSMVAFHTPDDVSFIDVTTILSSDALSTTGLFGGTAAGNTIYLGSSGDDKFIFSGVKVKIATDGLVEPENVIAEFWDGTQWQAVNYMSVGADYPHAQYGWKLAENGNTFEQWRFNFDPYNQYANIVETTVNGVLGWWTRFRIVTAITADPILEQVKLHTSRWECNGTGFTEYFGNARYKKTVLSGVKSLVNNAVQSPQNEQVTYITGDTVASYLDNQFNNSAIDSALFVLNVDEGVDTSIPVEVKISWYPDGANTGAVEFSVDKIPVIDGFTYDGSAVSTGQFKGVTDIQIPADAVRQTTTILVDINEASVNTAYVMKIARNATVGNPLDTLPNNVILTHIVVNAFFWKP